MKALTSRVNKSSQSRLLEAKITVKPALETMHLKPLMDCLIKPFQPRSALCRPKLKQILDISMTCSITSISQQQSRNPHRIELSQVCRSIKVEIIRLQLLRTSVRRRVRVYKLFRQILICHMHRPKLNRVFLSLWLMP